MDDSTAKTSISVYRYKEESNNKKTLISVIVRWVRGKWCGNEYDVELLEFEEKGDVNFEIESDVALIWLMLRYCDTIAVDFDSTQFEYKAARLRQTDTPLQLSMVPYDFNVIFACRRQCCWIDISVVPYISLCIRMHKEKDRFRTVRRDAPLLPQLLGSLYSFEPAQGSVMFVFKELRLSRYHTPEDLQLTDGDTIAAFGYNKSSCSLRIIDGIFRVKVVRYGTGKELMFQVRPSTRMSKVMNSYCECEGLDNDAVAFMYEGHKLKPSNKVKDEKLVNGAHIIVFDLVTGSN